MIFPNLSPEYYVGSPEDRSILNRMETFYAEAITLNQSAWVEADIDTRFWASDITLWSELYPNLPASRRKMFNFNKIRRVINMVSGHQRKNRKSIVAIPLENADDHTADQFTRILIHIDKKEQVLETISDAFEGALISGMNLLQVWLDFRDDPVSGTIRVDKCDYNSFLIDPYFRRADLSDCRALWKRSYVTKQEAISLMPDKAEDIVNLPTQNSKDGKFQYMPETYGFAYKDLLSYDEFYYRDYRTARILTDTQTGETLEWKNNDEEGLKEYLRLYPMVTVFEQQVPTVKLAVVIQGRVFYDGPNPLGIDRYPFVPTLAYYNPQLPYYYLRIQSMVRDLRDSQYLYARRKVIELDILESQVNSGWIYKENALVNPRDVFLSGQGRGLALKESAQMTDVQQIQPPQIPPSMMEISAGLSREIMEISGVNEELLGAADDDKAGVLAMLRQGAGLTTLQPLYDQLDQSQRLLGRIMIETIQTNYTPGKVQMILREQPTEQFYNKAFGKYDCVVEDGLNTSTQKQMQFAQLLELKKLGVDISDEDILGAATIQNKSTLTDSIKRRQQAAQQAAQQQAQIQMQEIQARTELSHARAMADRGLGAERVSRIQENQALAIERKAEAEKDHFGALLNFVKSIKELEGLDIANLEKLMGLARVVSQEQMQPTNPQPGSTGQLSSMMQGLQGQTTPPM
jgi:hypothetical protein